jgi:hypothetical protein
LFAGGDDEVREEQLEPNFTSTQEDAGEDEQSHTLQRCLNSVSLSTFERRCECPVRDWKREASKFRGFNEGKVLPSSV